MPAGVSWGQYLRFTAAALLSMMAGSQTVHLIYRPLEGLDNLVKEKEDEILRQRQASQETSVTSNHVSS